MEANNLLDLGEGIFRTRDLEAHGLTRKRVRQFREQGKLECLGRGLYRLPDSPITQNHTLALVATYAPHSVVGLLSALQFHEITTQCPWQVWLLVEKSARTPTLSYPPLRVLRASGTMFIEGVEEHVIEGTIVRVTGVARTVVDCFKYRNKVGLDIALEALREGLHTKKVDRVTLRHYARLCRMERVMSPYLEALSI